MGSSNPHFRPSKGLKLPSAPQIHPLDSVKTPKILKAIPPRLVAFLRKTEGSHSGLAFCGTPVIPFQTLTGKPITDNGKPFARIRLYDATEAQKYHQRSGSGTHIYIPHGLLRGATLILTEGEFKAASLAEAGFCAVGLCGMSGAMRNTDGEPKLHDELVNVLEFRQPAKVLFLGDSDAVLNSDFSREAAKLRKTLFASKRFQFVQELRVAVCPLDGPKGVDDVRAARGEQFSAWLESLVESAFVV